jgi:hypothetical protein
VGLSLPHNVSVTKLLRQRSTVGGVVFYAVLVASEQSRQSVPTRISFLTMLSVSKLCHTDDKSSW